VGVFPLRRKALQLARELLRARPGDIREALLLGLAPKLAAALRSGDAGVREAALSLLALLVQHPGVVAALQQAGFTNPALPLFPRFRHSCHCSRRAG
jgi:hypothetical protein